MEKLLLLPCITSHQSIMLSSLRSQSLLRLCLSLSDITLSSSLPPCLFHDNIKLRLPVICTALHLYYNSRRHFVLIFAHNSTVPIATAFILQISVLSTKRNQRCKFGLNLTRLKFRVKRRL